MLATRQIPPIDPGAPLWGLYDIGYGLTLNVGSLAAVCALDNASWTKNNVTISANAITAPDGTLTADKIVEDTANAIHYIAQNATGMVAGTLATWTGYLKYAGRSWVYVGNSANGSNFNLSTGAMGTISGSVVSRGIADVGNGWYLIQVTTADASIQSNVALLNADSVTPYVGDGVSGVYAWNVQVDQKMCSQWTDQSLNPATGAPNGHDLVQATAALQPVLVQGWNGRPCLKCDGAGDFLKTAGAALAQPYTIMLACDITTLTAAGGQDTLVDGNVAGATVLTVDSTPQTVLNAGAAVTWAQAASNNRGGVITMIVNGASSSIRVNGQQVASGNAGAAAAGGFTLCARADGTRSIAAQVFGAAVMSGAPTDFYLRAWERWWMARYSPAKAI